MVENTSFLTLAAVVVQRYFALASLLSFTNATLLGLVSNHVEDDSAVSWRTPKSSARLCDLEHQCDEIYVIRAHPRWAPCGEYRLAADEPLIKPGYLAALLSDG